MDFQPVAPNRNPRRRGPSLVVALLLASSTVALLGFKCYGGEQYLKIRA